MRILLVLFLVCASIARANAFAAGPSGDAFYAPPVSLPLGGEGTIVWARPVSGGAALPSAAKNYLVLYETAAPSGTIVAVSGALAIPRGAPPAKGWPLISWAHGTTGNGPQCAPSRGEAPDVEQRMLDRFVQRGYAVAETDYEGNGTPGIHPYMVASAAAHDVADMAVAARAIDPQIGRDWVVMGHSEGGASALSTAALGQRIAPSLNLLGAVAYAPFTYPESTLQLEIHSGSPNGGLVITGLLIDGFSTVDPRVVPAQIVEPSAMRLMAELPGQCVLDLMRHSDWSATIPTNFFRPGGEASVEALYGDLVANNPATFAISIPTLLVQGVSDSMVSSVTTLTVSQQLRRNGTPVTFKAYVAGTHGSVLNYSVNDVAAWLAERFSAR